MRLNETGVPFKTGQHYIDFDFATPLNGYSDSIATQILVRVSVNNNEPMDFVIDTGFGSGLLIHQWAANKIGLVPDSRKYNTSSERIRIRKASLESVAIVDASGQNVPLNISQANILHRSTD